MKGASSSIRRCECALNVEGEGQGEHALNPQQEVSRFRMNAVRFRWCGEERDMPSLSRV